MERSTKGNLEEWNQDEFIDVHRNANCGFPKYTMKNFEDPPSISGSGSAIAEFYRGRSVFITGGTGFVGKVLMEKLLRSCPGIVTIYLLLRPKKEQDVRQRLLDLLGSKLFVKIKRKHPEMLKKLVAIRGDITEPSLGINQSNTKLLQEEVSVVFHSAATVRFEEPLKVAVQMNVMGTKRVMELSRTMTKLVSVIHVSTAYCNCDREEVAEIIYPVTLKPNQLNEISRSMDNEVVRSITPTLLGARPNTYTYTKAMAEYMLEEEHADLPIAVVRPSIVTSTLKEPFPGWVDSVNGPVGIFIATGKGLLRLTPCYGEYVADWIPVDILTNFMISVGWYTSTNRSENIKVYNCTSGSLNPITWNQVMRYIYPQMINNPIDKMMWHPTINYERARWLVRLSVAVDHYMPAYLLDLFALVCGRKRRMVCVQDRLQGAIKSLMYFQMHQWKFTNDNLKLVWESLHVADKKLFPFDVTEVSWQSYLETIWVGIKIYLLDEEVASLAVARRNFCKTMVTSQAYNLVKLLIIWRVLAANSGSLYRIFYS